MRSNIIDIFFGKVREQHLSKFFAIRIQCDFCGNGIFTFLGIVYVCDHAAITDPPRDIDIDIGVHIFCDDRFIDEIGNGQGIVDSARSLSYRYRTTLPTVPGV